MPDLAGWHRNRLPSVPNTPAVTLAPDWVSGVGHAWLFNPAARALEVYRREGGSWVLVATFAADAVERAEPFDAIELDLLVPLWGGERPPQVR